MDVFDLPATMKDAVPSAVEMYMRLLDVHVDIGFLENDLDLARQKGAIELARAFVVLRHLKEQLDEVDATFTKVFEVYKTKHLPDALEAEGVTSVPLAEGFRVGVSNLFRASIRPGAKDRAFNWLVENGLDTLITQTVNAQTLSAAARQMMEDSENPRELPEELFNVALIPNTSVRRT